MLEFVVKGGEQVWTLDFTGRPTVTQTRLGRADHSLVFTENAFAQIMSDTGTLKQLYQSGQIQLPGLAETHGEALGSLLSKMEYLLALMRHA